ncbi:hypothetical protein F2Q69_00049124 [Brassica cretica]|uniref:Uncharacterized protein n=1 Tax=Brassica cretica TaxID=69181 RepID=A0A8S9PPB3_BRACR|nr:hypothetical protein F2Q69_00049124 [Brassica cretica]
MKSGTFWPKGKKMKIQGLRLQFGNICLESDGELDFDDEHNHEDELITARRARRKSSAVEFVGRGSEKTVTRSRIGLFTTGKIGFTVGT